MPAVTAVELLKTVEPVRPAIESDQLLHAIKQMLEGTPVSPAFSVPVVTASEASAEKKPVLETQPSSQLRHQSRT